MVQAGSLCCMFKALSALCYSYLGEYCGILDELALIASIGC